MVNPLDADLTNNNGGPWSNDAICNPSGTTCGVHLHAIDSGAFYSGVEGKLGLKSLDSMLISIGDPLPAPTPLTVPNPLGGVHFSLVDNTWNTNVSGQIPGRTITITLCILLVTIIAHQVCCLSIYPQPVACKIASGMLHLTARCACRSTRNGIRSLRLQPRHHFQVDKGMRTPAFGSSSAFLDSHSLPMMHTRQ